MKTDNAKQGAHTATLWSKEKMASRERIRAAAPAMLAALKLARTELREADGIIADLRAAMPVEFGHAAGAAILRASNGAARTKGAIEIAEAAIAKATGGAT